MKDLRDPHVTRALEPGEAATPHPRFRAVILGIQPHVKPLRSSHMGFHPQSIPCRMTVVILHMGFYPQSHRPAERHANPKQREFFIDNLPARIHFIIEMIWWTDLAPWEFEFPVSGSLESTFLRKPSTFLRGGITAEDRTSANVELDHRTDCRVKDVDLPTRIPSVLHTRAT